MIYIYILYIYKSCIYKYHIADNITYIDCKEGTMIVTLPAESSHATRAYRAMT